MWTEAMDWCSEGRPPWKWEWGTFQVLYYNREIKPAPSVEKYVQSSMALNKKRFLTQLRYGCLPLEVELGRYRSPKPPLRANYTVL